VYAASISFFRRGVRVDHRDHAGLAFAQDHAGLAPAPVLLPGESFVVQHPGDRIDADRGQPSFAAPQGLLERRE
jgi:hypothetical protein